VHILKKAEKSLDTVPLNWNNSILERIKVNFVTRLTVGLIYSI
jgi:hypothetical protein